VTPDDRAYPALQVTNLTKSYGDRVALDDVTLTVRRGELVALVGTNGAGKSTLLQVVAGLLEPSRGTVLVEGEPAGSIVARTMVSFVADQPALYDDLNVNEHIEYVARLHGLAATSDAASELLDLLQLANRSDDLPARFSRGLRQKTSILLGLVRPFSLLLVDEPFVGLDPGGQRTLVELVEGAVDAGAAVVLATHQLAFLDRASRCLVLQEGRLEYSGPVDRSIVEPLLD
jgi:ABC-type multidrug transport system ATPase subunit